MFTAATRACRCRLRHARLLDVTQRAAALLTLRRYGAALRVSGSSSSAISLRRVALMMRTIITLCRLFIDGAPASSALE